jgi:hypothetical protein
MNKRETLGEIEREELIFLFLDDLKLNNFSYIVTIIKNKIIKKKNIFNWIS